MGRLVFGLAGAAMIVTTAVAASSTTRPADAANTQGPRGTEQNPSRVGTQQPLSPQQLEVMRKQIEQQQQQRRSVVVIPPTTRPLYEQPDDMPAGSSRRQFNGFSYYIVPLGK